MPSTQKTTQQQQTTATWKLDPAHSEALFSVRHMMIATVHGTIPVKGGTVRLVDGRVESIVAELDAAGIHTGAQQRDDHLRSPDFFDTAGHPMIRFESRLVSDRGDGTYEIVGDLTIRGVTREVTLEAEKIGEGKDPWGATRAGIEARTTLDRKEFGLNWNVALEAGGWLVGDKVKVTLNVQVVRAE